MLKELTMDEMMICDGGAYPILEQNGFEGSDLVSDIKVLVVAVIATGVVIVSGGSAGAAIAAGLGGGATQLINGAIDKVWN